MFLSLRYPICDHIDIKFKKSAYLLIDRKIYLVYIKYIKSEEYLFNTLNLKLIKANKDCIQAFNVLYSLNYNNFP